jgi:hypothetical protein
MRSKREPWYSIFACDAIFDLHTPFVAPSEHSDILPSFLLEVLTWLFFPHGSSSVKK